MRLLQAVVGDQWYGGSFDRTKTNQLVCWVSAKQTDYDKKRSVRKEFIWQLECGISVDNEFDVELSKDMLNTAPNR